MDEKLKRLLCVLWVVGATGCLVFLFSGCSTVQEYSLSYKLWDEDFRKWSEPSPNPHLAIFETPGHTNLLVAYDAYSEKHAGVKRQAYYLQPNQGRIGARKAPKFVAPVPASGMQSIPVFEGTAFATNPPTHLTNYAILSASGREFTLHPQVEALEPFQLPVYPESSGTLTHVALTPLAVVGDTAMVGLVAGVVALYALCQSAFTFSP
jgi:hypothetical protein